MENGTPPGGGRTTATLRDCSRFRERDGGSFCPAPRERVGRDHWYRRQGGRSAGFGMGAPQHGIHRHVPPRRTGAVVKETPQVGNGSFWQFLRQSEGLVVRRTKVCRRHEHISDEGPFLGRGKVDGWRAPYHAPFQWSPLAAGG